MQMKIFSGILVIIKARRKYIRWFYLPWDFTL